MPDTPPDEPFIPLAQSSPRAGERPDMSVRVVAGPPGARPFQSLAKSAGGAPLHGAACEPRVSVERDGGRVSAIRVQCSCGQIFELACVYES